jgi:hypothetical protein
VTRNGGATALESASGRELYFTKFETVKLGAENGLWRMALPDGAEERVAGPIAGRNFETRARGLYFIQESRPRRILRFLPYGGGSAVDIVSLEGTDFGGLTISPDERVALYSRADETNTELILIDGFWRPE